MNRFFFYKKGICLLIALVMCLQILVVPRTVLAETAQPVGSYLAERWSRSIEGAVAAKPVIGADGKLYILSQQGKLYAFSSDGNQLWTAEVLPMDATSFDGKKGQLELGADGIIYVGSRGNLYAFNASGVKIWEHETTYPGFQKVEVQRNGLIYIQVRRTGLMLVLRPDGTKAFERGDVTQLVKNTGTMEDKIYIISQKRTSKIEGGKVSLETTSYAEELSLSGSSQWKVNLNGVPYTAPITDKKGNLIVFTEAPGRGDPSLGSFRAQLRRPTEVKVIGGGTVKRTYSLTGGAEGPIIFDDQQNAYIVTNDTAISKFDPQGKLLWKLKINDQVDLFEYGLAMQFDKDGSLLFYSTIYRYEMDKDANSDQGELFKQQVLRISPSGELLSSSKRGYYNPIAWFENGLMLSTGYNQVVLSDMQMSQPTAYQTNSAFYLAYADSNTIYVGTESGRVIALVVKKASNKGEAVSVSFGNVQTEFESGKTYLLQAVVKWADGKEQTNPQGIVYRSSNEKIAYFDKSGFHTVGAGEVELTAEYLHLKATMKVKIKGIPNTTKPKVTYSAQLVKRWSVALPALGSNKNEVYQSPLITADGTVYALSSQGKVASVNPEGKLQWQYDMNQLVQAKPAVGPDGRLYIGTNNGLLAAFDPISGKQLLNSIVAVDHHSTMLGWDRSGNRYTGFSSNSVRKDGNITSATSQLQASDVSDARLWSITLNGEIAHNEPVINDKGDTLYVITEKSEAIGGSTANRPSQSIIRKLGTLYALDISSGNVRWKHELGSSDFTFYKPILLKDRTIVIASSQGTVEAIDTEGQLKWKKNLKVYSYTEPFLSNEKLILFKWSSTIGLKEGEDPIRFMNISDFPESINQQQDEWLLTLSESAIAQNSRHSVASYDAAGNLKWQIPFEGGKTSVSRVTNSLQVAAIDASCELSLYDISVTRSSEDIFHDMKKHWAKEAVEELAASGVVTGFPDGTYRPGTQVTREQFLAMLSKKLNISYKEADLSFTDVAKTRWSRPIIESALAYGWIDAKNYGSSFKPVQPVTREEVAVWTAKALRLTEKVDGLAQVSDKSSIQAANLGLVGAVIDSGIIDGYKDGSFKPKANLTRAEAAVLLSRI